MRGLGIFIEMRFIAFLAALLIALPAWADTSFRNSVTGTNNPPALGDIIAHHDISGNTLDMHAASVVIEPTTNRIYALTEAYYCGFQWKVIGAPFCGFTVYDITDIHNPVNLGPIIDPAALQTYGSPTVTV